MKYTLEEIYILVGREDKTAGLTLRRGSEAQKKYGNDLTVVFLYTQKEREEMDRLIKNEPFQYSGFLKARILVGDLSDEQVELLRVEGIHSDDIAHVLYFMAPEKNTFHATEKRTINNINVQLNILPKGQDLDWMYGSTKYQLSLGIGLCPKERLFYLVAKYYYEPEQLTEDEKKVIFSFNGEMEEEIEYEYLSMKYIREEISESEKNRLGILISKKNKDSFSTLDKYLIEAGSSLERLVEHNKDQAVDLFSKTLDFKERRLNVVGPIPIFLDIDGYLHIYMRHVEEFKVNKHFEHKDNFQWNEDDVFTVMGQVIKAYNEEIQKFFADNPEKRYSKYGSQSAYFEGDYYTFHIDPSGRVATFHKNRKLHEQIK
ncbi:MAG: hypothetical protein EOO43_13635 [Flavobacterium sp.]|nr:MAG: hypothetical protein EOO43_13635 [Flavobacterium sp.]